MHPEFWQRIENIFQAAVELSSKEERMRYLDEICADDEDLRIEVEHLLRQDEEANSLLSEPLLDNSGLHIFASMIEDRDPIIGSQIGAYLITKEIGRGGMGAVYLAERADGSFRRKVAIKLIKRGMDTDFILRRFRQERQILASLAHPYIARLIDGGTTDDGLPFFLMEYIEGKSLYKYSDANKLSIAARLRLFHQVCEAIEFAHQNHVVHRDIKPSNILVTADGVPKLLDFGIAKVLDTELNFDITVEPTATAVRMMTPEYASPEQVSGQPITPASDIYSLGVLLYELLTGHRPYHFKNRAPHEIARVICEEEPEKPSFSVTLSDNLLPTGASEATTLIDVFLLRSAENLEELRRLLKGDLEKIILKTLRKKPLERYQSAQELADDITRFLEGEAVIAESFSAPAAVENKTVKFADEVKSLAVLPLKILNLSPNSDTTGDEFLSLGLADAMITRLSGIRRLAVRPTSAILRYGDESVNPLQAGIELSVDYVLDGRIKILGKKIRVTLQLLDVKERTSIWANQIDEIFTDALELEDKVSEKVAEILLPQLTDTEKKQFKRRGTESPEAFEAYLRGRFYWNKFTPDGLAKVLECFQAAIEIDRNYALAYVGIAEFYIWANIYSILPEPVCFPKAEAAVEHALRLDADLGEAYAAQGLIHANFFRWEEAEQSYKKSLELNPNNSQAHEWYAALLVGTGRFDDGIKEILEAERLDSLSLRTLTLVSWTLYQTRRYEEALAKAEQLIEMDKNYPQGYLQRANNLIQFGRYEEALADTRRAIEIMPESPLAKYPLFYLLEKTGRHEESRKFLNEMREQSKTRYIKPYFLALAHFAINEADEAFKILEVSFKNNDPWLTWFGTEPMLDEWRNDERFIALFKQMNNPLFGKQYAKSEPDTNSEKSIAVLPLKMIGASDSENSENEFLCVGLADALITRLSNVRRFIIRPTSSVLPYTKSNLDPFVIARHLGVDFILDGNLRYIGQRIRISAQLLSVAENATRWAQTFDEDFNDVLSLEDKVAEQVSKSILPYLTGEEEKRLKKRSTDNPQAFEAYLRGRFHWTSFTEEGFAKALIFYNQAIAIAPDYALAYAGIADYYNLLGIYAVLPFSETSAAAKEAALKAISSDDTLAEGYAALGFAILTHDFDWTEAETNLQKAMELNPNYITGRVWVSHYLSLTGKADEALENIRRAVALDPLTPIVSHTANMILYYSGRFEESIKVTEKFIEREPRYAMAYLVLASILWRIGRADEAIIQIKRALALLGRTPYSLIWLASAYAAKGDIAETEKLIAEIEQMSLRRYCSPYLKAMIYANLRDEEKIFELLEKALEISDARLIWLGVDPQFNDFRENPRFQNILRATNNPLAKFALHKN